MAACGTTMTRWEALLAPRFAPHSRLYHVLGRRPGHIPRPPYRETPGPGTTVARGSNATIRAAASWRHPVIHSTTFTDELTPILQQERPTDA